MKAPRSTKALVYARAADAATAAGGPARRARETRSAYADDTPRFPLPDPAPSVDGGAAPSEPQPNFAAQTTGAAPRTRPSGDVFDVVLHSAESDNLFTTLALAIQAADLRELLGEQGPLTFFAPTDRAFEKLPAEELQALLMDGARLKRVLANHVVRGAVQAPGAGEPTAVAAVGGAALTITLDGTAFRVDGAKVVKPHARASNGVIRAIDTVLGAGQ